MVWQSPTFFRRLSAIDSNLFRQVVCEKSIDFFLDCIEIPNKVTDGDQRCNVISQVIVLGSTFLQGKLKTFASTGEFGQCSFMAISVMQSVNP